MGYDVKWIAEYWLGFLLFVMGWILSEAQRRKNDDDEHPGA